MALSSNFRQIPIIKYGWRSSFRIGRKSASAVRFTYQLRAIALRGKIPACLLLLASAPLCLLARSPSFFFHPTPRRGRDLARGRGLEPLLVGGHLAPRTLSGRSRLARNRWPPMMIQNCQHFVKYLVFINFLTTIFMIS